MRRRRSDRSRSMRLRVPGNAPLWWKALAVAALGAVLVVLLAGDKNLVKLISLYHERDLANRQLEDLQADNARMQEQIRALQTDPKAVELIAREELGLVRADEWVYRFAPPPEKRKAGTPRP